MKVFLLFYLLCCSCAKEIKIKTDTATHIKFIQPKQCKIKTTKMQQFQTEIIDDRLLFDNKNLGIFLNIIHDYKLAVIEFEKCTKANELYYQNVINEIIK